MSMSKSQNPTGIGFRPYLLLIAFSHFFIPAPVCGQSSPSYSRSPINYFTAPVDNPISRLQKRIQTGKVKLQFERNHGYLKSILQQLKISVSSQLLVFSKTSFQFRRISPQSPRALYFSDDVYVGWVQGSDLLEFSVADAKLGAVFYTLEQSKSGKPQFRRRTHECLQCHTSSRTGSIPGHFVRSVFPRTDGQPIYSAGTFTSDHSSPFHERWGGWYVTGKQGGQSHLGNLIFKDAKETNTPDTVTGANVLDLRKRFDTTAYLTPYSDIVALMVLEHQVNLHNRLTNASFTTRTSLSEEKSMNKFFSRRADYRSASTKRRIAAVAEKVVRHLLFVGEIKLTAPITGTSGYAKWFAAQGPRDKRHRSLRDFDLKRRMFKFPCSYLIYSEAFDRLPPLVKKQIYRRLWDILTGKDDSDTFKHLSHADRVAIREILLATQKGLPAYWK